MIPFLMADMKPAVARLRRALKQGEKILIYGDYDVDGTMAVVVLLSALRGLGVQVETFIPHRMTDGYGMRVPVVEEAAAKGFRVVISVDTGIRDHKVLARARELGLDCIVTDHHLPDAHLPPAYAILNPRRPDCGYPEKSLAGVGVAFKLVQALLGERLTERVLAVLFESCGDRDHCRCRAPARGESHDRALWSGWFPPTFTGRLAGAARSRGARRP